MRTTAVTALTTLFVLLVTSPAYAATQPVGEPPPTDNGRWVGVISVFVILGVAGTLIFIARAYSKNNDQQL
jgi:hypothetical protein